MRIPDRDSAFHFEKATTGSIFNHETSSVHLASFERKSPSQPVSAWFSSLTSPNDDEVRSRFIHSLAMIDARIFFDGGRQLPFGQESQVRDIAQAYRHLPDVRFQAPATSKDEEGSQPVTLRYAQGADGTYAYLVNEAPFATTAKIRIAAQSGCKIQELSGHRSIDPPMPEPTRALLDRPTPAIRPACGKTDRSDGTIP